MEMSESVGKNTCLIKFIVAEILGQQNLSVPYHKEGFFVSSAKADQKGDCETPLTDISVFDQLLSWQLTKLGNIKLEKTLMLPLCAHVSV